MILATGHPDKSFLDHLEYGFPVSGRIDAGGAGVLDHDGRLAHGTPVISGPPDLQHLRATCKSINSSTIAKVKPGSHAAVVWDKHKQEMLSGKVGPACPIEEFDTEGALLVERFGVEESRGGGTKVRIIDNFKRNLVNAHASLWEKIWNDGHDQLSKAVLQLQAGGKRVLIGKEDFVSAFKTVCPDRTQRWLMWALVYDTDNQKWVVSGSAHTAVWRPGGCLRVVEMRAANPGSARKIIFARCIRLCGRHFHG